MQPSAPADTPPSPPPSPSASRRRTLRLALLIPLGVVAFSAIIWAPLLVRRFAFEAFRVPSGSMSPTLLIGDQFFCDKTARGRMPARGDVIVFAHPPDPTRDYVSRVVAVAGDRVLVRADGTVELNAASLPRCELGPWPLPLGPDAASAAGAAFIAVLERNGAHRYIVLHEPGRAPSDAPHCVAAPCTVPAGHVLTLGDHRDNSYDGRFWGFVPVGNIKGLAGRIHFVSRYGPEGRSMRSAQADPIVPPQLASRAAACPADLVPRP